MTDDKRPSRRPGQRPRKGNDDRPKRSYGSGEKREERPPRREGPRKFDTDRPARKPGPARKTTDEGGERRPPRREGAYKGNKEFKPRRSGQDEGGERRPPRREGAYKGNKEFKPRRAGQDEGGERRPPRREGAYKGNKEFKPRRSGQDEGGERRPPRREGAYKGNKEFKPRRAGQDEGGERRPPRREGEYKGNKEFKPRRAGQDEGGERRPPRREGAYKGNKEFKPRRTGQDEGGERRPARREGSYKAYKEDKPRRSGPREEGEKRPIRRKSEYGEKSGRPFDSRSGKKERPDRSERPAPRVKKYTSTPGERGEYIKKADREEATIRLNKFIANAGICSRREADDLIKAGVVTVNGNVVTEMGTKVKPSDKIIYGGELLSNEGKRYLLLNKQKGYVTTTKDPHAKNTVMELIAGACKERIYPVGRLDRNTTGLLLFTNDGELSKKLMHPSSRITKLYHVFLDQPFKKADMLKVAAGVELEDGPVQVDSIAYDITADSKRELGVEIHSGKNRVIRRLFESFGYKVVKLDRVMFAGLTKKNLPRGRWRFLTDKEISILKRL